MLYSKTKNHWIFNFRFKIEKPKYKAFFFIMVKRGFTKLKKNWMIFIFYFSKQKITRKQKQKKTTVFSYSATGSYLTK